MSLFIKCIKTIICLCCVVLSGDTRLGHNDALSGPSQNVTVGGSSGIPSAKWNGSHKWTEIRYHYWVFLECLGYYQRSNMAGSFDEKQFCLSLAKSPTEGLKQFEQLKKAELAKIALYLKVEATRVKSMRKSEIKDFLLEYWVDKKILPDSVLADDRDEDMTFAIRKMQMQHELAMQKVELEFQKMRTEKLRLELVVEQEKHKKPEESKMSKMDCGRFVKLVPKFSEEEPDQFFLHFEKVAKQCEWDTSMWALLVQSSLTGRAQEIYSAMSVEDSQNYDKVKKVILKAYEKVPEAYRQKFRNYRKPEGQTFMEFSRQKEHLFDKWCKSKNVDSFDKLRQLILVEEFKRNTTSDLRVFLSEREVKDMSHAATLADDYVLTHKYGGQKSGRFDKKGQTHRKPDEKDSKVSVETTNDIKPKKRSGYIECTNCSKPGHLREDCWFLKKTEKSDKAQPMGLVSTKNIVEQYGPFMSEGLIGDKQMCETKVNILRDTGALQTLLLEGSVPQNCVKLTGEKVIIKGLCGVDSVPLAKVQLESPLVDSEVTVGLVKTLPVENVQMLMGNDVAGGKVFPLPKMSDRPLQPEVEIEVEREFPEIFHECVVTRSMAQKEQRPDEKDDTEDSEYELQDTFLTKLEAAVKDEPEKGRESPQWTKGKLVKEQRSDKTLVNQFKLAGTENDLKDVPTGYYVKDDVLMRKWRPPVVPASEHWKVVHQVVIPEVYRKEIISVAHDNPMAGHLGVNKTCDRVTQHFYWPGVRKDVVEHCKTCDICQKVGKPNQVIPRYPLQPIPVMEEPFEKVIVDCVGPLPKTKNGNEYMLTIMCVSTRFPEAIPLRNIKAKNITKALIKFFTLFGLPKIIQSDQGTNFMSTVFKQVIKELGIEQIKSTAYHPETQGALERFHQTLKNMIRCYCEQNDKDWDEGIPLLLFGAREVVQESLGFSPFELVFGRDVRGPLKLLRETVLDDQEEPNDILTYTTLLKERLQNACRVAREHLQGVQEGMKTYYDKKARTRVFAPGDEVLVLQPNTGPKLGARFEGPYKVCKNLNGTDYLVEMPDKRKKFKVCHVNMLKPYYNGESQVKPVSTATIQLGPEEAPPEEEDTKVGVSVKMQNSDVLEHLEEKVSHLTATQQQEVTALIREYHCIFPDVPGKTGVLKHDVDVGDATPIKQHPYRVGKEKKVIIDAEIKYMLENEIIEPCVSPWSSPCLLVPKPDGSSRFCTDYRKVNDVTKTDTFPIPRMEDCIDRVGDAKYVTKLDLMKGYWQVPLTKRACEISAFVTPSGLYSYKVMPFGMKNSGATFQRLMNIVIYELEGVDVYIDDLIIYSSSWEQHLSRLRALFDRLKKAKLSVNLVKSDFGRAEVTYLGHVVGCGCIKPIQANVEKILSFPKPKSKKEVQRFLGMIGYYRRFCYNFSDVVCPLTNLLGKTTKFIWTNECENAFENVKAMLVSQPVLNIPNWEKDYVLSVDASDIGAGAVLQQEGDDGILHPVSFFSKKFNVHERNYSTVEKEALALILAIKHYEVYLSTTRQLMVYTDHNPLVFIQRMKGKNQKILRWSLLLQQYNLKISHVKGKENAVADALSRI